MLVRFETAILEPTEHSLDLAARALLSGELVGLPTETVYGLAALAENGGAVRGIFLAKGRPADNPLIVHVARMEQAAGFAREIPARARRLMQEFWPGPLTLILPALDSVPREVTAGLSTVALRMPSHPVALELIRRSGALAAPSANRSGRPSPTTAQHVLADMRGKIPYILDGGPCDVGVESTVLDLTREIPALLRPGGVRAEEIQAVLGELRVDPAVYGEARPDAKVASPGMKYRHYAPRAKLYLLEEKDFAARAKRRCAEAAGKRCAVLCFSEGAAALNGYTVYDLGSRADLREAEQRLFGALHALDEDNIDIAFAPALPVAGDSLAYMNRMLRASEKE